MSENKKQNGEQQPSVVNVKYVVSNDLDCIDNEYYYKLFRSDFDAEYFLVSIDDIILAPGMELEFSIKEKDFSFSDDFLFQFRFDDLKINSDCFLLDYDVSFYVYKDLYDLNKNLSGIVVSEKDNEVTSNNDYRPSSISNLDDKYFYEVKLDEPIIVESIKRKFKKIYLLSDGLLIGNRVENFKINPESLFNRNNNTTYSKPVLYTEYYDKKIVLSKEDLALLKKDKFYTKFNEYALNIFIWMILITLGINAIVTKSIFVINWNVIVSVSIIIFLLLFFQFGKIELNKNNKPYNKDSLIRKIKDTNIIGTIFGGLLLGLLLFTYTKNYKYNSEYVYDTKQEVFLDSNSFSVPNSLFLKTNAIVERLKPVYSKYSIDLIFKNPGRLLTSESRFIDLEIHIEFYKGKFLLDDDFKFLINNVRVNLQYKLSNGDYGNLLIENQFDYDRSIIDIKEALYEELIKVLDIDSSEIKSIEITTKYAKLQNVEK